MPRHLYNRAFLDAVFHVGCLHLGDALLARQSAYAATGADPELLKIYQLFGNPR